MQWCMRLTRFTESTVACALVGLSEEWRGCLLKPELIEGPLPSLNPMQRSYNTSRKFLEL